MDASLLDSAELEIRRFVPPSLLQDRDIGAMDLDELARWLAKARYVEQLEIYLHKRALADYFGGAQ